jgi:hypothetical protein
VFWLPCTPWGAVLQKNNEASEGRKRGRFKIAFTNTNQAKRLDPDPQNMFALIGSGRHPPGGMTLSRPYWRKLACNSANAEAVYSALGMQAHLIRARLFTVKVRSTGMQVFTHCPVSIMARASPAFEHRSFTHPYIYYARQSR